MIVYLIRRLGQSLLVIAVMATLVFVAVYAVGDPVDILANPDADQTERAAIARRLGLDRPLWEQFGVFLSNALQGDLGRSFVYNEPAVAVILQRLPATLELALAGLVLSILIGIPLGVLAGLNPNSWIGRTIMSGSILGFSLPNFWIGLMLILSSPCS
jgi:peptide/nickel transport system permease protein